MSDLVFTAAGSLVGALSRSLAAKLRVAEFGRYVSFQVPVSGIAAVLKDVPNNLAVNERIRICRLAVILPGVWEFVGSGEDIPAIKAAGMIVDVAIVPEQQWRHAKAAAEYLEQRERSTA